MTPDSVAIPRSSILYGFIANSRFPPPGGEQRSPIEVSFQVQLRMLLVVFPDFGKVYPLLLHCISSPIATSSVSFPTSISPFRRFPRECNLSCFPLFQSETLTNPPCATFVSPSLTRIFPVRRLFRIFHPSLITQTALSRRNQV